MIGGEKDYFALSDHIELGETKARAIFSNNKDSCWLAARTMLGKWTGNREEPYHEQAAVLWVALGEMGKQAARDKLRDECGYDWPPSDQHLSLTPGTVAIVKFHKI